MPRHSSHILKFWPIGLVVLLGLFGWIAVRNQDTITENHSPPETFMVAGASDMIHTETVSFNAHIRPILSDKCFSCHGFDSTKREENLRLDTEEGAYAALQSDETKFAIVPGDAEKSAVWQRIHATDENLIMPPPDFHKPLSENEKELITRWIEQGAKYEQHWAFSPIVRPEVPETGAQNPIDSFIIANLEKHGLEMSPRANKATLLRRLSLDLIGLPPIPEELQAFLNDDAPDAYEKQVDRLLASPHYGERMAVPWLDAVRYADTVGYHGDQNARVFPYRDYVIDAFNNNKPFDQFTREQIAGDMLPDATDEQKIATGFLRLNLMTREGGAQDKEYRAKSAADRVRAIGAGWLGLTTGCAECHDHKFDPITARDFYALAAFFNDIRQWGIYTTYGNTPNKDLPGFTNDSPFPPELYSKNSAVVERLNRSRDESVAAIAANRAGEVASHPAFPAWLENTKAFLSANPSGWLALTPASVESKKNAPTTIEADHTVLVTGPPAKDDIIEVTFPLPQGVPIKSILLEALPDPANGGKIGRQENGKFALTPTFTVADKPLEFSYKQADRRTPVRYRNGFQSATLEDQWQSAPAIFEEPSNAASLPHHAVYHLKSTVEPNADTVLKLTVASADIGKIRVSISPFADPIPGDPQALRPQLAAALSSDENENQEIIAAFLLATTPDDKLPATYKHAREEMIASRAGYAHSMISQVLPDEEIPDAHILPRGDWMNPGEKVDPAFPEFLAQNVPESEERLNRLDLANWLMSQENPLPARHFMNRLWKQFFGNGLSNILDDIGNQGEWPSHPELMDWLAADFRDSGWDVKRMVRMIVTSDTYCQVSARNEKLAEIDPDNRLLSEQSPRRLDAEFIRDNALAIAGLLADDLVGGPPILPYQPQDYWANLNFPERKYQASDGLDQYRRGLYTHWQRTFVHPMLAAFDAPSREECSADRFQSNSPQQALVLLNDPTFVEASKALAARVESELPDGSDAEKIHRLYLLALAREPKPAELDNLETFLKTLREENPSVDPMQQLGRVILNLHETITRY